MQPSAKRRAVLAVSATAMSAVGLLSVPLPAQADPMIPRAPLCNTWVFPSGGKYFQMKHGSYLVSTVISGMGAHGDTVEGFRGTEEKFVGRIYGGIEGATSI